MNLSNNLRTNKNLWIFKNIWGDMTERASELVKAILAR